MLMVAAMIVLATAVATGVVLRLVVASEMRSDAPPPPAEPASVPLSTRIVCRVLFVTRVGEDLILDCVAAHGHPSRTQAAPGTPFAVGVSAFSSTWFADSMERFLRHLAAEDRVVSFELATGPAGDRLDVRSETTRMRFDLRSRVGLS